MAGRKTAPVGAPRTPVPEADRRKRLVELRNILHTAIKDAEPKDLSALAGRYQAVLAELAGMPDIKETTPVDDLSARRRRVTG